jgi:ABC-2 type transport system ATP-binding protein
LHELATQSASLEEAFMELTRDSVEFHAEALPADVPIPAGSAPREET